MKDHFITTSLQVLERTPITLHALLNGYSDDWLMRNEGPNTWSAFDVLSHLIFCEQVNFFTRIHIIRSGREQKMLPPFDMSKQFELSRGKKMALLLEEFKHLRKQNLASLRENPLSESDLSKTGIHPKMGMVTLRNVLATWAAHDLAHTAQIVRVMARQYKEDVGPFIEFLRILN